MSQLLRCALLAVAVVLAASPVAALEPPPPPQERAKALINQTLDNLHDAAAKADGPRYFADFAPDAVYIGTDASERWSLSEFRAFADPYFAKGKGWVYRPRERHIVLADLPCLCVAWFDELLDSESYGTSRGTGVLVKDGEHWRIAQYALTFPIPNDLAHGFTDQIKAFEARAGQEQK